MTHRFVLAATLLFAASSTFADAWGSKHADVCNTGRASFSIPAARQNATLFDIFLWQTPAPGSPNEGNFSSSSMAFYDGVGPGGADVVVGGYHWPKGVQGMDRRTGRTLWNGNPSGGESIGVITPAFSNNGQTIYVTNDATGGHPLMAFDAAVGPSTYWHNGGNPNPDQMGAFSPLVAPDGRIFLHAWVDRPYAAMDTGAALAHVWAAGSGADCGLSGCALYSDGASLQVVIGGRWGRLYAYDGASGAELWNVPTPTIDATPTIDPANGNVYVPAGSDHVYVVGVAADGSPLWGIPESLVFVHVPGENEAQRAQSAGCLSHDGATYYFQTNSPGGEGALYAVNTLDGSVKWTYATASAGWESISSSPIVTPNGIIIVGNNTNGTYYALRDDGASATLLDSYTVGASGSARSSATLSADGLLYLPLRTLWVTPNGNGDIPTQNMANVFCAFDLNEDATTILPPPADQGAFALNSAVRLTWRPISDPAGQFSHYAVYRDTAPFDSVAGLTPIAGVPGAGSSEYVDTTAVNGVSYYYAVTSVTLGGGEATMIDAVGPRTPRDETDLQVVNIARTPRFPRYDPIYTYYSITEPSGFGPYIFSAATSLGSGQSAGTQRWPNIGQTVTYVATVRNRGTNPYTAQFRGHWFVDGAHISMETRTTPLEPGETTTFMFPTTWDGASHDVRFELNGGDSRPDNNARTINTKSVPFLTYLDASALEKFREDTINHPMGATDDFLDWLNRHMDRFNQMFADAGSPKRVHYDVLEVLPDGSPDPASPARINFAIFPFRYHTTDGDPRLPGYYSAAADIDFGLLHEMGHQLGLIDLYQLNIDGSQNQVNGQGYSATAGLMNGVSQFLSQNSAMGMTHWLDVAHGYYGQYLYDMPAEVRIRALDVNGDPLPDVTVTVYQKCERPGIGGVISDQVKAQGVTNASGEYTLPNVPIDPGLVPTTFAGDTLRPNPFGYVAVVGTNGVLLIKLEYNGFVDWAWLELPEVNNAYRLGQTDVAVFDRQTTLGGRVQYIPPAELTELNAADWTGHADGATYSLADDTSRTVVGSGSIRFDTNGGFDTYLRYPGSHAALWDLSYAQQLRFWAYAVNPNLGFQSQSPWLRIGNADGWYEFRPPYDVLNEARNQWREFVVPLAGSAFWSRTTVGTPDLTRVHFIELHSDTWDAGFTLWIDGMQFEPVRQRGDLNCDGAVNFDDIDGFITALIGPEAYAAQCPGCLHRLADVDENGTVTFDDIDGFVCCLILSSCRDCPP